MHQEDSVKKPDTKLRYIEKYSNMPHYTILTRAKLDKVM